MQLLKQKGLFKGLCTCLALAGVCLACAAYAADTNAVQMVTYFPVPYAQYNNLYPQNKLDIGTVNGKDFDLNVGNCSGDSAPAPFTATNVNLRKAAGTPVLKMKNNFKTTTATFGKTDNNASYSTVTFSNLYLSDTALSVSEVKTSTLKAKKPSHIYMLKAGLPDTGCASGVVKWVSLDFGTSKKYLVCCEQDGSNCGKACQGMEELERTCKGGAPDLTHNSITDTNAGSQGSKTITSASLTYQKNGTWNSNTCSCSCPTESHGGSASGSSLNQNEMSDQNDYSFCMHNCWWDEVSGGSGRVSACTNAKWTNPANSADVRTVGAKWKYNNCTCDCDATNSNYKNVDNYSCTHKCHSDYQNGTVKACTDAGFTWNDGGGTCKCDCGDYNIYKQSGKLCADRCVKGNPTYKDAAKKCTDSNGTWNDDYNGNSCGCNCGTTNDGRTRNLVNGVCQDPPAEEEPEPEPQLTCSWTENGTTQGPSIGYWGGTSCGTHPAAGTPSDCSSASCTIANATCIVVNSPSQVYEKCYYPMKKCTCN